MKRSAHDEYESDAGDVTYIADGNVTWDGRTTEKRQRSVELPTLVGPFTFAPDGSGLQQAVVPLHESNMPGVYRVQARAMAPVRLWIPQRGPGVPLETDSRALLGAIQHECIFLFDTRQSESEARLQDVLKLDWLLSAPAVHRYAAIVSKHPPRSTTDVPLPYIQDPSGAIMAECHVYDYLGPSAVCIRDGELLGTMMLQRSTDDVLQTLRYWE